jgi:predicted HNH restriction endonuclease
MALVTSLEPNAKERSTVHRPTRCLFAIVEGTDGARYLQLDTVGSEDRAIPDKVSQSIQFDRQAAGQLLQLLHRTFPDLVSGVTAESDIGTVPSDDEEDEEGEEGKTLLKLHRLRERKPRLVRRKKQSVLSASGRLACEVCSFDFVAIYGPLGDGFAECHHRSPLAALPDVTTTRLSDLAIVCANCHRMLHRRPYYKVEQLRELVLRQRAL